MEMRSGGVRGAAAAACQVWAEPVWLNVGGRISEAGRERCCRCELQTTEWESIRQLQHTAVWRRRGGSAA